MVTFVYLDASGNPKVIVYGIPATLGLLGMSESDLRPKLLGGNIVFFLDSRSSTGAKTAGRALQ